MIDFHSHILPAVDDGSQSVEESLKLLEMLKKQGIDTVAATSHFYAERDSVDSFLERRDKSFEALRAAMTGSEPRIIKGAEVCFYPGISRLDGIRRLCMENTNLLLLEMPPSRWTDYTVREVAELAMKGNMTVLMAHVERYMSLQKKGTMELLRDYGVLMQVNASFFNSLSTKRRALSMLRDGEINAIGSDCHNTTSRPPSIGKAYETIGKKLGDGFLNHYCKYGKSLLNIN